MFTNILKYTTLQKVKISYSSVHQKLQDLLYQQLKGLSNKVMGVKRQVKKEIKRKEEFSKLDEFDLSVIRRIVHGYYARNENFSLKKLFNKLRDEIHFAYLITTLSLVLKMLGFKYKKRQRESIVQERADLVSWRELFMRRIQEIRKNEPDREIVYTDETWLNAGHRMKKEWVDLEALQNLRLSIADRGTVGCTKDLMERGKRLIIVDCITENGPIRGALWTFSTESKTKKEEKHDFQFIETAVAEERDRENENSNQKQEDQMHKYKALTSGKKKS